MIRELFRPLPWPIALLVLSGMAATAQAEELQQTVMASVEVSENGELLEHRIYAGASYLLKPTFERFIRFYNYPTVRDRQGNVVASKGTLRADYRFVSNEDDTFNVYLDDQTLLLEPDKGENEPRLIKRKNPFYPRNALAGQVEGWVLIEFTITKKGKVRDIEVVAEYPRGAFGSTAKSALKRWRFEPILVDGSPADVRDSQIFEFLLQSGK